MKKLLTSLLCVVMVVCMMPAMAWADEPSESEAADATKAIKVEYDGNTYYFAAFGELGKIPVAGSTAEGGTTVPYNGVNQWMIDKTKNGKTIEITLQDDITVDTYKNTDTSSTTKANLYNTPWTNLHIPSGRTVILNMNGHTITGNGQNNNTYKYGIINNYGNLTINGSGTIENQSTYGCAVSVGDSSSNQYAATLSINNVTLKSAESPNATKSATVYAPYGTIDLIDGCSFVNSGQRGAINIGQYGKITTVKNSKFTEGITTAIYISNALQSSANPMIGTIENCTINCSTYGICGAVDAYAIANIGTIKDTTITASSSAVWAVRHIDLIENCKIEVTGHDTNQSATAAKIIQTTLGIGRITGDTYIKGNLAIPVYTDGGTVVIESGTFESSFDTVIYAGNSYTNSLEILGGTYIKGEKVLGGVKDSPVVLAGNSEITYPFGKTLDKWPANEENTFTLDYNAEKIQADTAAALAEITAETDDDSKADLAAQLQENINAISDETMRASAQEQADETVKTVNGTVTITLWDGTANQEVFVAKGSIPVIADPTKTGYTFAGWYTDEDLRTKYTPSVISENLKLYAKWTANSYPYVPTTPTVQKPAIEADSNATVTLDSTGTTATITVADGYELADVTVNGVSKGAVTTLTGLKTGDKVVVTTKKTEEPPVVDDSARIKAGVQATTLKIYSKSLNTKGSGKGWIQVRWVKSKGFKVDGYELYRGKTKSTMKRYDTTTKTTYTNKNYLKKGSRYYYKVRGYRMINGEKVYTQWSKTIYRLAK